MVCLRMATLHIQLMCHMIHMSTTIELNFTKLSRNPMSPLYAQPKLCQALLFLTPIVLLNKLVGGSSKIENIITALPEVL